MQIAILKPEINDVSLFSFSKSSIDFRDKLGKKYKALKARWSILHYKDW